MNPPGPAISFGCGPAGTSKHFIAAGALPEWVILGGCVADD
jgi:hypothetical protein